MSRKQSKYKDHFEFLAGGEEELFKKCGSKIKCANKGSFVTTIIKFYMEEKHNLFAENDLEPPTKCLKTSTLTLQSFS